ncbi:hypothetical protein GSI_11904 [Ganoderma sinense ZZ0214-1]|uniref:F-box domain-containing protein n=1 Tax=Ganoderma sinense ZZ0214-1 TaxID=1077348 RepID=A0A2G8RXA5_9APHY|nr:hypothetical protein GSI_11904 [Ganoderma sinense ZZ0214-1]
MHRQQYIRGNAFADAKTAIEELLCLHREEKRRHHLKSDKHAPLYRQPQLQPPRANIVATPLTQPSTALFSLPSELKEKVCVAVADEATLAMLAQTCKFLSVFVEEFRFLHVVNLLSPRGLASFRTCLSNLTLDRFGRTRTQKIQSIVLRWKTGFPTTPSTAADLEWVLARLPAVRALCVDIPTLHPIDVHGQYHLLPSVSVGSNPDLRTLHTTAAFSSCLAGPVPPLTCLTLDMVRGNADVGVYTVVSALFGSTLRRLRVLRNFGRTYSCQSPVRICAALQMHRLEYLEVRDTALMDYTGLMDVDAPAEGMMMAAAIHLPALETLVWAPAWRSAYFDSIRDFERTLRRFQCHLLAVLEPITLHVCVSDTRVLMSSSEEGRTWYVSEELVDVHLDQWKNDAVPQ